MGNSDSKQRQQDPYGYIERLLSSLSGHSSADVSHDHDPTPTYFSLLPPDLQHLLSRYLLFQEGPISLATLAVFPRKEPPKDLLRRVPAPITIEPLRHAFGALNAGVNHPFFVGDAKFKAKADAVMVECIVPEDDELLMIMDTTALGGCDHFIAFSKYAIFYRFAYDITAQRGAYIPYRLLCTLPIVQSERYIQIGPYQLTGSAMPKIDTVVSAMKAFQASLVELLQGMQLDVDDWTFSERILQLAGQLRSQYICTYPVIPHRYLIASMRACRVEKEEQVLVLVDHVAFSAPSSCLVITPTAVLYANSETSRGYISFDQLAAHDTQVSQYRSTGVEINVAGVSHVIKCGSPRIEAELPLVQELQKFLRANRDKISADAILRD